MSTSRMCTEMSGSSRNHNNSLLKLAGQHAEAPPPGWFQPLILATLKCRVLARWINQACFYEPEPLTGHDVVNNANNAAAQQTAGLLNA